MKANHLEDDSLSLKITCGPTGIPESHIHEYKMSHDVNSLTILPCFRRAWLQSGKVINVPFVKLFHRWLLKVCTVAQSDHKGMSTYLGEYQVLSNNMNTVSI